MFRQLVISRNCAVCGINTQALSICSDCELSLRLRPHFATRNGLPRVLVCSDYSAELAKVLAAFKATGDNSIRDWLAKRLAAALREHAGTEPILLVALPSTEKANRHRGFVPAFELAKAVSRELPASRAIEALWYRRTVADQAGLTAAARAANLASSMVAKPAIRRLQSYRLAIIDDVITTGSSMAEAYRAVTQLGVKVHYLFAYAETLRKTQRDF